MARNNQPDRWESLIFASALAIVGTWFLFDRLALLTRSLDLLQGSLHASPALLLVAAVSLIIASAEMDSPQNRKKAKMNDKDRGTNPAVLNGGALIVVGVLLLLDQMGIIVSDFWALVFGVFGLLRFLQARDSTGRL
jgi:hypothetical protein